MYLGKPLLNVSFYFSLLDFLPGDMHDLAPGKA
jgi:hypothetical protein